MLAEPPKILHYGLLWEVNDPAKYSFDKHWHYEFQATRCPPWDLEGEHTDAKGGLFAHPPRASSFNTSVRRFTCRRPRWKSACQNSNL